MVNRDINTNIMIDMECTDADSHNPVILELAAVHFNIDTGAEFDIFHKIINYESCKNQGLDAIDLETEVWLSRGANTKRTLALSKSSTDSLDLKDALLEFSDFVNKDKKGTLKMTPKLRETQAMIWGNGAMADNVWIRTAYQACNMKRPWEFYNDMCVRTFVKQCGFIMGRNFTQEIPIDPSKKHMALEDCRNQIEYLVEARNTIVAQKKQIDIQNQQIKALKRRIHALERESSEAMEFRDFLSGPDAAVLQTIQGGPSSHQAIPDSQLTSQKTTMAFNRRRNTPPQMPPTPETSFSSSSGDYGKESVGGQAHVLHLDHSMPQATSSLGTHGIQAQQLNHSAIISEALLVTGEPNLALNESTQKRKWSGGDMPERRNFAEGTPKQLPTPETSFSDRLYEAVYESMEH